MRLSVPELLAHEQGAGEGEGEGEGEVAVGDAGAVQEQGEQVQREGGQEVGRRLTLTGQLQLLCSTGFSEAHRGWSVDDG